MRNSIIMFGRKYCVYVVIVTASVTSAFAQTQNCIIGPTAATSGTTVSYTTTATMATGGTFTISGGTLVSTSVTTGSCGTVQVQQSMAKTSTQTTLTSSGGTTYCYTANVKWGTGSGGTVTFAISGSPTCSLPVVICPTTIPTPNAVYSISNCGTISISYTGTPPANTLWYWQTSSTGTSASNSTASMSSAANGNFYVRAFNLSCNAWSAAQPVNSSNGAVTINPLPAAPTGVTSSNACGNTGATTVTGTIGSGGNKLNFYTSTNRTTPAFTGSSWNTLVNGATTFYVASLNSTTGCSSSQVATTPTILTIPTVTASNTTLCGNNNAGIVLTNNIASVTNTWTASSTNASGANNSSGISSGTSPYTYTLGQILNATTSAAGAVTYTITPSANGCSGVPLAVTATVKPLPTVSASNQSIFSAQQTQVAVTNPNNVTGTTFSWTALGTNVTGAVNGSGATIAQTLSTTTQPSGTVTYTITPYANGCNGSAVLSTVTVYPLPIINASSSRVVMGSTSTMDAGGGYSSYSWKNSAGVTKSTAQVFSTNIADTYTVTVTKAGIVNAATSIPFQLQSQFAGQPDVNYITTHTLLAGETDTARIKLLSVDSVTQHIEYYDGLGRPVQTVTTQGSPSKIDMVIPMGYDAFGRENKKYLPYTNGTTGWYKSDALGLVSGSYTSSQQYTSYNGTADKITDDTRPYSETLFEASPLNRPTQDFGAGQSWMDNTKYVAHAYLVNDNTQEHIVAWAIDSYSGLPRIAPARDGSVTSGYYNSGQLTIKSTKDEQGHEVREYTDKRGHVILKKVQASDNAPLNDTTKWAQTYYIYNDFGHLVMVLSPEAVNAITK